MDSGSASGCCSTTSTKTGAPDEERRGLPGRSDERTIIHFYFDTIDQEHPLLRAQVTIDADRLSVRFSVIDHVAGEPSYAGLFRRHCERLDLLERFRTRARGVIGDIVDDVKGWSRGGRAVDVARLADLLAKKAEHFEQSEGTNSWKAALWGAMARAHDVLGVLLQDATRAPAGA